MLRRAFARLKGAPPVQKWPITIPMLTAIRQLLNFTLPEDLSFWAALVVGFFGFLRKSTLLPKSNTALPSLGICRSDALEISTASFILRITHSKTIQFGQRVLALPFAACTNTQLCPVRALLYQLYASPLPASSPLFAFKTASGTVSLTQAVFARRLKTLLRRAGFDATKFSAHSLRRGERLLRSTPALTP